MSGSSARQSRAAVGKALSNQQVLLVCFYAACSCTLLALGAAALEAASVSWDNLQIVSQSDLSKTSISVLKRVMSL